MIRHLLCAVATASLLAGSSGCSEQKLMPPPAAPSPDYTSYMTPAPGGARPAAGPIQEPGAHPQPITTADEAGRICPMSVPGTLVSAVDTPTGIILTFTTSTDKVDDLRRRVHHTTNMHNAKVTEGAPGYGAGHKQGVGASTFATGEAADVPGGARISFSAEKPRDVAMLRAKVRKHAQRLSSGDCSMQAMAFSED